MSQNTVMIRQIQPGSRGRPVKCETNAFAMNWKDDPHAAIHHYDAITPTWEVNDKFKISGRKGSEIIMRLQISAYPEDFHPVGAFDGKKNLYSVKKYDFASKNFMVKWESDSTSRKPKQVEVRVVYVTKVNLALLRDLLSGKQQTVDTMSGAMLVLNMLNVFVQASPKMLATKINTAKSFYTPLNKNTSPKIKPLELWRGYFQSVRPSLNRIIVNVDITTGVIVPRDQLMNICMDYLNIKNQRQLAQLRESDFQKLRHFVKGMKVEINLPKHKGKRPKSIKDLVKNVGETIFDMGGKDMRVDAYFKTVYGIQIYPGSLGVKIGQDALFPVESCNTIEQLYKSHASPEVIREALAFTPATPNLRKAAISDGWDQFDYSNSQFLRSAGIHISPQLQQVNGRLLPPLKIGFGEKNLVDLAAARPGVWDVMRKKLFAAAAIERWAVVDFANCDSSLLNTFIQGLTQAMLQLGMPGTGVQSPSAIRRSDVGYRIEQMLAEIQAESGAHMILAILPESAEDPYRRIKRFGDITRGFVTQCVKWSRNLQNNARDARKLNQYHNNLILKINVKLGGINYIPLTQNFPWDIGTETMFVGADVSHPGPGSSLPSIAALVGSYDQTACLYSASISVQDARTEVITDFEGMFAKILQTHYQKQKTAPSRIFVFRDGVSEGEFTNVMNFEMSAMKGALLKSGYYPKPPMINYVVVGKRHHFRFFPDKQAQDPQGNGNLQSGFVLDRDVVHPAFNDFYLQSQPGLKGTSRPSHYTVMRNSMNLTADSLEELAFTLCHCYSRSTRSVKIPAPVYYADLVCRRAKFHFDEEAGESISRHSNTDTETHTHFYQSHFQNIHDLLKDSMYFV